MIIQTVPRSLEEPARIFGLTPMELAACAITYAAVSTILRGVPFSALLSLLVGVGLAVTMWTFNRVRPPLHGLFYLLAMQRKAVTPVMDQIKTQKGNLL